MTSLIEKNHCANETEMIARFVIWSGNELPHWKKIAARFCVSRATAYRWRAALKAARGIA